MENIKSVILIVEDEVVVRTLAAKVAKNCGFEVLEASSADEAIDILEARSDIRLVFTDVNMPGSMDGLQLAGEQAAAEVFVDHGLDTVPAAPVGTGPSPLGDVCGVPCPGASVRWCRVAIRMRRSSSGASEARVRAAAGVRAHAGGPHRGAAGAGCRPVPRPARGATAR